MADPDWRDDLKKEVPREEIPGFLSDLQAVIARLRAYRDDLKVPDAAVIVPFVTPILVRYRALALRYIDDPVYRGVLDAAIAEKAG